MRKISERIISVQVGMLEVNCYLVKGQSGKLYIIDPGDEPEKIIEASKKIEYNNTSILLTHAHVDHISATGKVKEALNSETVYLNPQDKELYLSPENKLPPFVPAARDLPETSEAPLAEDAEDFEIIETPGHTPGGVCFYFKDIPACFCGDTVFRQSIGRTDFPGGNHSDILKSINRKILTLPEGLALYPGHGPPTTPAYERSNNPFLL
jgi:glyoxylase-like metal-dependent hydrolase (beta-lactamase superfamily II)